MGIMSPIAADSNGNPITAESRKMLGKDDFLQLLIAKLTHQDPLKPMEDEQFVAQLAQFSTLEQMQNINDSLTQSLDWDYLQMQTINNTMATSLIGREVNALYRAIYLDDSNQPGISFSSGEYAENIKIQISDAEGVIVRSLNLENTPPGSHTINWDGRDKSGNRLKEGFYNISITATDANGDTFSPSTYLNGQVSGVVYREGAAFLTVDGVEIPLSDVRGIFQSNEDSENDNAG